MYLAGSWAPHWPFEPGSVMFGALAVRHGGRRSPRAVVSLMIILCCVFVLLYDFDPLGLHSRPSSRLSSLATWPPVAFLRTHLRGCLRSAVSGCYRTLSLLAAGITRSSHTLIYHMLIYLKLVSQNLQRPQERMTWKLLLLPLHLQYDGRT